MKRSLYLFLVILMIVGCEKSTKPEDDENGEPVEEYSIQNEINKADEGDTVLIEPGIYKENIDFMGKNIVLASLFLTTGDASYINSTIIEGDGRNGAVVSFQGGEDSTALLTGFRLRNSNVSSFGGGILCENASPRLEYLHVYTNNADHGGAILCQSNANPVIKHVVFEDNDGRWGGGIKLYLSTARFENCTIINNSSGHGGVIWVQDSNPVFENVDIIDNSADDDVGGGFKFIESEATLRNVRFIRNSAGFGGAIHCAGSDITLENVIFYDNHAIDGDGSAIYTVGNSNIIAKNVVFSSDTADVNGGAIFCASSSITLINSILWGDLPQEIYFAADVDPGSITISYSNIQGGEEGIVTNDNATVTWSDTNIDEEPLFLDVENGDFHLQEGSPCIDTGNPDAEYNDPDGSTSDMGAYGGPNGSW